MAHEALEITEEGSAWLLIYPGIMFCDSFTRGFCFQIHLRGDFVLRFLYAGILFCDSVLRGYAFALMPETTLPLVTYLFLLLDFSAGDYFVRALNYLGVQGRGRGISVHSVVRSWWWLYSGRP